MEAKIDALDVSEIRQSSVPSNSPKISKFGPKAGFVIPKNKLSGSLVPIFRGSPKPVPADVTRGEGNQQSCRKTKWGVDPTQDASVRKGRILAYQTRLEQITQLLKAGDLAIGDDRDLQPPLQLSSDGDSKVSGEKLALLELEKREVIGEILRLNPNYKSPSDYKPLLKEDKVPIPIKAYPEYNFIVLLLGPESNALKRLEEETGVKVQVLGTKAGTGEKKEIVPSELNEPQSTYEDLYVHVSAETFEKVDAAIALIELLLTPVIANHAATTTNFKGGDGGNVPDSTKKNSTSAFETMPLSTGSQVAAPQVTVPAQPVPLQYRPYPAPWYPTVPTSIPMQPSSGTFRPPPSQSNPIRFPVPSSNVAIRPQPFGVRPPFPPVPRNSSGMVAALAQQSPMNVLQRPMVPQQQNVIASAPQPSMHQPIPNRPPSFPPISTTSTPIGGITAPRTSLPPQASQVCPTFQTGPIPSRPLVSPMIPGNSGWSNAPSLVTPPTRPSNMQVSPAQIPPQRLAAVTPRTPRLVQNLPPHSAGIPMGASQTMPSFPSRSSVPTPSGLVPIAPAYTPSPVSGPSPGSTFPTGPHAPASGNTSALAHSTQQVSPHPLVRGPFASGQTANPLPSPIPAAQLPMSTPDSVSGSLTVAPQLTALKPPRPSSGDFTFQPVGSPAGSSTTSSRLPHVQPSAAFLPGLHGVPQPPTSPNVPQAVAPPQSPSFRPAMQNSVIPIAAAANTLPQQAPTIPPAPAASPANVPANSTNIVLPLPRPIFPNSQSASPTAPFNHRPPLMFPLPPSQSMGSAPPGPPIQNQFPLPTQPRPLHFQTQQFVGNNNTGSVVGCPAPSPRGNQIYDPFSPTSIPSGAPLNSDTRPKAGKNENDVEYEDLMASMGVR